MAQPETSPPHPSLDLLRRVFNHAALLSDNVALTNIYRDASRELAVLATAVEDGTLAPHKVADAWRKAAGNATQFGGFIDTATPQVFELWQKVLKISLAFDADAQAEVARQASISGGTGIYGFVNLLERQAGGMSNSASMSVRDSARRMQALIDATAQGNYGFIDGKPATLDDAFKHALEPVNDANMAAAMSDGPNGIYLQEINKALSQTSAALKSHLRERCEVAQSPLAQGALKPVYSVSTQHAIAAPQTAQFRRRAR